MDEAISKSSFNEPIDPVGTISLSKTLPSTSTAISINPVNQGEIIYGNRTHVADETYSSTEVPSISTETSIPRKARSIKNTLESQITVEVKDTLLRIEHRLKKCARYNRKRFFLEKESLQLYKLQMEREENQRLEDKKLKMEDLEIRRRQLDIEERKICPPKSGKENESPSY